MRLSKAIVIEEKKKRRRRRKYTGPNIIETMREIMLEINFEMAERRAIRKEGQPVGGFANLKTTFDNLLPYVAKATKGEKPDPVAVAAYLQLRALFEIAGNLDSISLSQRAQVEQFEKMRISVQEFTASALEIVTNKMEEFKTLATDTIQTEIAKVVADLGIKDDTE